MNAEFIILIILAVSTIALVASKTHVAFVTLALCAGWVLSENATDDLVSIFNTDNFAVRTAIHFTLLLFPPLIISYRFRRSQTGGGRFIQQLVPAFALSLLGVIFIFDALPAETKNMLEEESIFYSQIELVRDWVILFAIFTALFDVLMQHAGPPRHYKKRKKE